MSTAIATALIAVIGSLSVAAASYWFTKQRERDAEWRKEKLIYYKSFVESLSGIVEGDATPDGHRAFAKSSNNLLLFAPQSVIQALDEFKDEIRVSNKNRSLERHDKLLSTLLFEIRSDIGVCPQDDASSFSVKLWASGAGSNAP